MRGFVLRTTGSWYRVRIEDGQILDCRLRGNYRIKGNKQTNPIAVGDYVQLILQDDGTGLITDIEERTNYIVRRATKLSKQTHVLAANIDQLCLVATLEFPRTSTGFIDRMLVTAEAYHIPSMLIFNKIDLYDEELWQQYNEIKSIYQSAGYPVYEVSAQEGTGVAELRSLMSNKISLFSGHSGVGKSALLNALDSNLNLRVGEVSEWSLKGKHTTTFAELFPFAGGYIIDSPGIKEFGMVDFTIEELGYCFPEFRPYLSQCYFSNCTHQHEPKCAVKEALKEGAISMERYQNYLSIIESLKED